MASGVAVAGPSVHTILVLLTSGGSGGERVTARRSSAGGHGPAELLRFPGEPRDQRVI